jgi:hypothetical protein
MLSIKLLSLLITISLQGQAVSGESLPAICPKPDYAQGVCALLTYKDGKLVKFEGKP